MLSGLFQNFADACSGGTFFGIPHWYDYLVKAGLMSDKLIDSTNKLHACELASGLSPNQWVQIIFLVALAVLDIALRLAGAVAVAYVIYGGIQYVTSQGEPDKTKDAQQTLTNALIGLAIALVATAFVSFIGNSVG
jgi:hypothetical protein